MAGTVVASLLQADSMKKQKKKHSKPRQAPAKCKLTVLNALCKLIPTHLVPTLAREHGIDKQARSFSPWSHVVALIYCHLTRALSLHDICDALRNHTGKLIAIRGATAPPRNTFSHANRTRDPVFAEHLYWALLGHFQSVSPNFGRRHPRLSRRFKRLVHVVDSTTISLVANSIDWAQHRRRKAAAKCHMRLNLQDLLPRFVIIDTANTSDAKKAWALCAPVKSGEIVIFDKAYVDFSHLWDLAQRGVVWVTRAKENLSAKVVCIRLKAPEGNILSDDEIVLLNLKSKTTYPERLRRIQAKVTVNGKETTMIFLTNNMEFAASTICDLYRCRWAIETFFKELKQTLQLCDFIGYNENAVKWQIWMALVTHLLVRYMGFLSEWTHSFTRLWTMIRGVIWERYDLLVLLRSYGTAGGCYRAAGHPELAFLPGLEPT